MRITVVWMKPAQQRIVRSRCPGAKLRFFEQGDRLTLQQPAPNDHVVLVARLIAHKTQQQVLSVYPRERVHVSHGGICRLCALINRLACEG